MHGISPILVRAHKRRAEIRKAVAVSRGVQSNRTIGARLIASSAAGELAVSSGGVSIRLVVCIVRAPWGDYASQINGASSTGIAQMGAKSVLDNSGGFG